ncbi:MAG: hypothetical protein ABIO44_00685 [Saprospiraceae bacterium]
MRKNHLICYIYITLLYFSCDPYHDIDYQIKNNSNRSLTIISSIHFFKNLDTNIISPNTHIILLNVSGIGQSTSNSLKEISSVPFDTLLIVDQYGKKYSKNPMDFNLWKKENRSKKGDNGEITLTITDLDFN